MKNVIFFACATALSIGAGAAATVDQNSAPVVVRGQIADPPPTRRVSYADLNLASQTGQKTLYHRVSGAVNDVCEDANGPNAMAIVYQSCRKFAWNGAKPQMNLAIERAQQIALTGTSTIAPVAIAISVASR